VDSDISNLIRKGNELMEDCKFEESLSFFDQALVLQPNNPDLLNKKGVVLRSLGRYDEAIECFNKSLQLDPRDLDSS
jgi:tetratricopeptide (TPR) repeat protein